MVHDSLTIDLDGVPQGRFFAVDNASITDREWSMARQFIEECLPRTGAVARFASQAKLDEFRAYWPAFDSVAERKGIAVIVDD